MKKIFIITIIAIVIVLVKSQWYHLTGSAETNTVQRQELIEEGLKALETQDVPVAALLLYQNKIIGRGYNTVQRDTNIGGHAEINAISDAIKGIGFKEFNALDRDSLCLVTTFEPCMMCSGAIIENRIKQVYFIKDKSVFHWLKNDMKGLLYEIHKHKIENDFLQDSLFELHPLYPLRRGQ